VEEDQKFHAEKKEKGISTDEIVIFKENPT
jgi:hypothetical protein